MENKELLNNYNYVNFDAKEWASIVLGIRKSLNLSQSELSSKLGFSRFTVMRYENCVKKPRKNSIKNVFEFIDMNNLDVETLKESGKICINGFNKDMKIPKLNLEYSKELAELIGILLGDGEIMKDGTLRIAFDPKKDLNYHYRRTFAIIKQILGNKISFESHQRFVFYNMAFVRYLKEDCSLNPGSKFKNNWVIPNWCYEKDEYSSAVLRGIFDTDGYIGYKTQHLEIILGRFSSKCFDFVKSISKSLNKLGVLHRIELSADGRYKVRIKDNVNVLKFINVVGSSNLKHIVRFLLWRLAKFEAKIEIHGLDYLIQMLNTKIHFEIQKVKLPFFWSMYNENFQLYIQEDLALIEGAEIRNLFKWSEITRDLIRLLGNKKLALKFNISERSVRKWREGIRNPSYKFILKLIMLSRDCKLNLDNYKNNKMATQTVETLVEGGRATAAPPLGPAF